MGHILGTCSTQSLIASMYLLRTDRETIPSNRIKKTSRERNLALRPHVYRPSSTSVSFAKKSRLKDEILFAV